MAPTDAQEIEELLVENAKAFAKHIAMEDRIRELEAELVTWKEISVTIEKARDAIRVKTIEECAREAAIAIRALAGKDNSTPASLIKSPTTASI